MPTLNGELGKIRQSCIDEGRIEGAKEIIIHLLEFYSASYLSNILGKSIFEINEILNSLFYIFIL